MAEAEEMSDRVAILLHGQIAAIGSPLDLTATGTDLTKVSVRSKASILVNDDRDIPAVSQKMVRDEYAIFFSTDIGRTVGAVINTIEAEGDDLIDLRVERPSLEDRFLEITKAPDSERQRQAGDLPDTNR
jgi:ABC-2 type transport system ATP-binding protein